jgi:hypothetical protein
MSVIGNEFSGLPMDQLIGGPLKAACDAQIMLAKASSDFINTVGFNPVLDDHNNPTGKVEPKQVDFSFWEPLPISPKPEILAVGTVKLEANGTPVPATDNVSSIKVNSVEILGTTVPFDTDLATTAKNIATEINDCQSTPKYEATANGAVITIKAMPETGSSPNGFVISVTCTSNLKATASKMAGGQDATGATTEVQKVVLSVPFLAIVNVPALMVKTVDITFDMEVKSSETHKDESTQEASLDASAKVGWGPFSAEVKIHGAVSAHQENTRSTDRSAKYHVSVQARDEGMPEGLSRVLDILQKAIAPVSISKAVPLKEANIAQNQTAVV